MQCPNDGTTLTITDRQGIEIDFCPTCRGVWLDRGELDKLIDRTAAALASSDTWRPTVPPPRKEHHDDRSRYDDRRRYDYDDDWKYKKRKKRSGFLGELFDFD
jgi:Zn-finger nucleic acid-binding protein